MTKPSIRLGLNREVVRELSTQDMKDALGGGTTSILTCACFSSVPRICGSC